MSATRSPQIVVLAGPNGEGKSTCASALLRGTLGVTEFVNADTIALGLSAFAPERAALQAGRIMLQRIRGLASRRVDFAFETTLASRTYAPWLVEQMDRGYRAHLVFLWLPSPELAISRVADRVRRGGHDVPAETIRRRFDSGLRNFFTLYRNLVARWQFHDASRLPAALLAFGEGSRVDWVEDEQVWTAIQEGYAP